MGKAESYTSNLLSDSASEVASREPRMSVCPVHAEVHNDQIIATNGDPFRPNAIFKPQSVTNFTRADRSLDPSDG